ncbi:hypothetical protein SAMN05421858_2276 [Haladaptatus litoreus]|uniref:Uncharacterized protein n=1 Tax=Haladaptatus litoreus TaxID=553468 RepID=A0A1N7A1H6_9EURY|nr:hypothetical protein SAMN05421858_2276 [Haladaptatus litoreus]
MGKNGLYSDPTKHHGACFHRPEEFTSEGLW